MQIYKITDVMMLFAELQPSILAGDKTVAQQDLVKAISAAVELAENLSIPIISSTVPMGPPDMPIEMIDPVARFRPVLRSSVSLLDDEVISTMMESSGRRVIALGGVSSEIAILHSCLGAIGKGYEVHILIDCCAGLSPRTEGAAFRQMEKAGAHLSNVSSFFTAFVPAMSHPNGKVVFSALSRYWGW